MNTLIQKSKIIFMALSCLLVFATSCSDFLDVSKELAAELDEKDIFSNPNYVRRVHRNIMAGTVDPSLMYMSECNGFKNPWPYLADELSGAHSMSILNQPTQGFNPSTAAFHRWSDCYQYIRQANLFLTRAYPIINPSGELELREEEFKYLKAIAYFYRAYYHYLLFELYGPIPIMDYFVEEDDTSLDFARNSVDETINFIDGELVKLIKGEGDYEGLKEQETDFNYYAVPSKMTVRALRAKLWMHAASPLLNGGYEEALEVTNHDGKALFPPHDPNKWVKAVEVLEDFIKNAESLGYGLYKEYTEDGLIDPDKSIYGVFMSYNPEIIWATSHNSFWSLTGGSYAYDRRITPRGEHPSTQWGCISVTQELVDDFFMNDGLPTYGSNAFPKSPLYPNADPFEQESFGYSKEGDDVTGRTETGTYKMWINREPRFYASVWYNNRRWQISNRVIQFHKGGNSDNSSDNNPIFGYLLHKRYPKTISKVSGYPSQFYRPSIIWRLAEFYLLYAEALNEVNPNDPKIFEYVDYIRERAGIPTLQKLQQSGQINIQGNKDKQREAIQRESRVELCTEGQRYFDVRRWMIAEPPQGHTGTWSGRLGGPFHGMNMNGIAGKPETFYKKTFVHEHVWRRAMYLYPIPFSEIQNSELLVQNPLWDSAD